MSKQRMIEQCLHLDNNDWGFSWLLALESKTFECKDLQKGREESILTFLSKKGNLQLYLMSFDIPIRPHMPFD